MNKYSQHIGTNSNMISYKQHFQIQDNQNNKIYTTHNQYQENILTLQNNYENRNIEIQADYIQGQQFYKNQDLNKMKQVDQMYIQDTYQNNQTQRGEQQIINLNRIYNQNKYINYDLFSMLSNNDMFQQTSFINQYSLDQHISRDNLKQINDNKDKQHEDNQMKHQGKQNNKLDSFQNITDKIQQKNKKTTLNQQLNNQNQPSLQLLQNQREVYQVHFLNVNNRNIENLSSIRNEIPNRYEISQNAIDIYDPNLEDLVACQVPESIPIKTQLSNRMLDTDRNNQNQKTINLSLQTLNQKPMNPVSSPNNNIFLQNQEQKCLNNTNSNENDDICSIDMQSSNSSNYNKTIPTSNYYHPSKRKINSTLQIGNIEAQKQIQTFQQEEQQKIDQQQNDLVLETDEIQQDIDENGNLKISKYQKTNYNNVRLYSQFQQKTLNQKQSNSDSQIINTDTYMNQPARKKSLFLYNPTMFQSITGQFYPQSQSQQDFEFKFNEEEAFLNLKISYYNQPQKYTKFENLIKQYLISQKRVYIQKINREISGLQSAENLGDYFIRKYNSNLQKRVSGCSRAQVFPVYIGVRGDGNCFYRALIVSYLVHLLTKEENVEKFEQFIFDIIDDKHPLIQLEYQGNVRNDSDNVKIILVQQLLLLLIERKQSKEKDEISLFIMKMFDNIANDHDFDYSLVSLCRSMISYSLDHYGTNSVYSEYFLQEDIEITRLKLKTYKEDAEYHAISLSTEIFRYPIQIIQLLKDKNSNFELNESVIYSPQVNQPYVGKIYILLSDGHYDLIFDRGICLDYFPSLSLFKNHQKYRDDLQNLIDDPNTQQNQKQNYQHLINNYSQFLKEQDIQIYKVRESFANLQTLHQSKVIERNSIVSLRSSNQDSEENELAKNQIIQTNTEYINQNDLMMFDSIISQKQSQLKNSDYLLFSEGKSLSNELIIEKNDDKNQNLISMNVNLNTINPNTQQDDNQNSNQIILITQKRGITSNLYQSEPFSNQKQNQYKSTQAETLSSPFKQNTQNVCENYYNTDSNRFKKQQSFSSTSQINNGNMKKNIKQLQEQKDQFISCIHSNTQQITIQQIFCCKIQYEICYPCFKTHQIFNCINCKKDILSYSRLNTTCKAVQYHCKKCKSSPQTIVLFNKIYCIQCDIQKQ